VVDWGAGRYELTAVELEPVARLIVERAAPSASDVVVDVACGTGNAALLAAARGARVIGVDTAPRLLEVARRRAMDEEVGFEGRQGDLLELPVDDGCADIALSVFGVIFASDPPQALGEIARILRPGGRALVSAWIPAGPIHEMLAALGRILRRAIGSPAEPRFAWHDPAALGPLAADAGLTLRATTTEALAIEADSPESYWTAGQQHPMAVAIAPALAGREAHVREAMTAPLREANEDPRGFLVHSPYVVHELRLT
jgi:ubiquinone/menaquinone biosynthesis C-methylase UbiE